MSYRVRFWGTRGSIPTPGPTTIRYGGNTPCLSLESEDGQQILAILDAGTGIRALGQELVARDNEEGTLDLLVSHTHWDHIQGLPFFAPILPGGYKVRIWGAKQAGVDVGQILRDQMSPVVFPVPLDEVAAEVEVREIEAGSFTTDHFHVRAMTVRHPGTTMAYALQLNSGSGGGTLGYVTDNELSGGHYEVGPDWREEFVTFLRGVDVLVHDAMYTTGELRQYTGWGHSSNVEATELAVEAQVNQLVLFHHAPEHDDGTIDAMLEEARDTARRLGSRIEIIAAKEGMDLLL